MRFKVHITLTLLSRKLDSMKTSVYNQKAEQIKEIEIAQNLLEDKVNDKVVAQYVYIYLSNQRQGNANVKDKSEVRGGGKKPYAQKGTGRARAGSIRSPIWRGGGVTFGPSNNVNWKRKTTKNFRASAFRNVFTKLLQEERVKIVDNFDLKAEEKMTKKALELMQNFNNPKKLTIVTSDKKEPLIKAFSNIKNARIITINRLNPYDLLVGGTILLENSALEQISEQWGKQIK